MQEATGYPEPVLKLRDLLNTYLDPEKVAVVLRAFEIGSHAHEGQTRKTGEPYILHPVAVAQILANMRMDHESIAAAILHDTIEDTPLTKQEITRQFGEDIAELVDGVTKLDKMKFRTRVEADAESFRKLMLAMSRDLRVIFIKLSDRLHNVRTLESMTAQSRRRIARETLDIYAPIADRLGMNSMKHELEDMGFANLYPWRHRTITEHLDAMTGHRLEIVSNIMEALKKKMNEASVPCRISGRQKSAYSIYKKMLSKDLSFSEVTDFYAFRIITQAEAHCYLALGAVHSLYQPKPGRFKDFIALPKSNGYQSLHTTLFGPKGLPLEVQIRTREMDRVAESGVASHWQYKAEDKVDATPQRRARQWLSNLAELQQSGTSEEFLESVKVDLFPDKIYVFTPKGDIMPLPKGSTTVDFAYAVHTDVGNRCVAAKVDRALVPLRTELHNGATVEVITSRGAKPNPNWLSFVRTAKARTAIRNHMKKMRSTESVDLGKRLLDRTLKDMGSSLRKVGKVRMNAAVDELGLSTTSALFEQLGLGERLAPLTAAFLLGVDEDGNGETAQASLTIAGTEGMVVSYAKCCSPIPGDDVMGYLSSGRGVVIHRNCCGNLSNFRKNSEKWIACSWEESIDREFSSQIQVDTFNKPGVLAEVAATIGDSGSNIEQVEVLGRHEDCSMLSFLIQVRDRKHLARIMRDVRNMPNVVRVARDCA